MNELYVILYRRFLKYEATIHNDGGCLTMRSGGFWRGYIWHIHPRVTRMVDKPAEFIHKYAL
jgi:hypothetical protein